MTNRGACSVVWRKTLLFSNIVCCARRRETGDAFSMLRRVRKAYTILAGNLKGVCTLVVLGIGRKLFDNVGWI
jgi:hypothetical protein